MEEYMSLTNVLLKLDREKLAMPTKKIEMPRLSKLAKEKTVFELQGIGQEKLDEITDMYYFTSIMDKRATDVNHFKQFTNKEYILVDNYVEALDKASAELKDDEILVVTGSLHFISNVITYFRK